MTSQVNTVSRRLNIVASYIFQAPEVSEAYASDTAELAARMRSAIEGATTVCGHTATVHVVDAGDPLLSPSDVLEHSDALVLLGGIDVDPHRYTDDPASIALAGSTFPLADENESALVHAAVDRGLPILAICRGAQLLNVTFGGTIVPDLGPESGHSPQGDSGFVNHEVSFDPQSRLAAIYGAESATVPAAHHQAVDRVAPGFSVSGTTADGVVEAIEAADERWILGIQWHPEAPAASPDHLRRLIASFLEASAARVAPELTGS